MDYLVRWVWMAKTVFPLHPALPATRRRRASREKEEPTEKEERKEIKERMDFEECRAVQEETEPRVLWVRKEWTALPDRVGASDPSDGPALPVHRD